MSVAPFDPNQFTVRKAKEKLGDLNREQLLQVLADEKAARGRRSLINAVEERIGELAVEVALDLAVPPVAEQRDSDGQVPPPPEPIPADEVERPEPEPAVPDPLAGISYARDKRGWHSVGASEGEDQMRFKKQEHVEARVRQRRGK
jgi:hypothetical protein